MEVSSLYKSSSYRSRKKTSAVNSIIPVDKRRLSKKPEKYVSQSDELSDKSDKQEGELSDKSEELSEKSYKHEEELSEKTDKLEEEELSEKSEEELTEESRVDSKYYELAGKAVFYLKVPDEVIDNWFGGGNGNRSLFICLDISASMGDAMTQAKEAILQIIEGLVEKGVFAEKDITCFFFNKSCRETRFGDDPNLLLANGEIRRYFDEVNAGGGTDFSVVFRSITKNLDRIKNNLSIIFFTDGQNNAGELEEAKVELKNGLTGFPYTTEIHSVGFTREHDARLLSWLTNCGSKNGNFIYVKSSEEILEKMKTTLNLLEINTPTLYVKVDGELLRADLDEEGNAMFVLPNDSANKQITILKDLEGQEKFESQPVQIHADDPLAAKITTKYIQREVVRLMSEISDLKDNVTDKQETFDKILAKVAMFENQFETFSQIVSEDITKYMASTKSRLDKFKVIVTEAKKGNLTNEAIAIFNDGLYKDITPQGLSKKKKITYESHQRLYQDLVTSYEQKKFCDITIKVGSSSNKRIFKANSFILCIRSSYFHKELSSDGMSIDRHVVEIPDMLPREFEVLLRYIYTGVISFTYVSSLELFDFLLATIKLDCGEVVNYLESQLTTNHREWILENFRLVCNTCRQYKNLATLYKFCAEDVMEEILKRFLSDDFENIEEQLLVELLKSEKLKMDAFEVWLRILKWGLAKHPYLDTNPRNWSFKEAEALFETLKDLIPLVQFLQISKSQFFKSVYPYKKIVPDELIDDLVYHHVDPELRPSIFDQIVV